jgi:monoamine oxidase
MAEDRCDVAIIGAGLAGAMAAVELCERGLAVTILEARDRAGGRGYFRKFDGPRAADNDREIDEELDYGGSWITPWQSTIRGLCARYGVALRPRHPVTARRWFRDGELHHDGPVSTADRTAHERAIARIAVDAALLKKGHDKDDFGRPILGIGLADYMQRLQAPAATLDLISAWWTVSGNGDKALVPASEFLHSCGHVDGTPDGIIEAWTDSLIGGVSALSGRMIAACGAKLFLDTAVAAIEHNGDGVRLATTDGKAIAARAALIATGLNPMAGLRFSPALPPVQSDAVRRGHAGRAVKLWAKVRGVAPGILATGGGNGIEWMFAERVTRDGATLLVGFGVEGEGDDAWVKSHSDVAKTMGDAATDAVARFFPEAELVAADWHDWNRDPFSRGAWVTSRLGAESDLSHETWKRHGRLAFASSDISPEGAGWFDAAAISGAAAAREIMDLLRLN